MPVYEYECTACGYKFEIQQKLAEKPLKVCPKCNKKTLEKLVSASNFHLRGEGWHKTDYNK
jgi:putative FmdB family regulatory protein